MSALEKLQKLGRFRPMPLTAHTCEVKDYKLLAIKGVRLALGVALKDAKDLVEEWASFPVTVNQALVLVDTCSEIKIDGPIDRLHEGFCRVCDDPSISTYTPLDLWLDPDEVEMYEGWPLCEDCELFPMGELLGRLHRPTVWERLLVD